MGSKTDVCCGEAGIALRRSSGRRRGDGPRFVGREGLPLLPRTARQGAVSRQTTEVGRVQGTLAEEVGIEPDRGRVLSRRET